MGTLVQEKDLQQQYHEICATLTDFVSVSPFDNVGLALSFLHYLDQSQEEPVQAFKQWQPDSVQLTDLYGGTNCIGASLIVKNQLEEAGIEASVVLSPSNNLVEGATYHEVPFQHVGLFVQFPESDIYYLVEPGLGLVLPIPGDNQVIEIADRSYLAVMNSEGGELLIGKPDGSFLNYDFVTAPEGADLEGLVQKPLLQATPRLKIDVFNENGEKTSTLKIDLFDEEISYIVGHKKHAFAFDQVNEMFDDESFKLLVKRMNHLSYGDIKERIQKIVSRKQDLVDIWVEGLQKEYYLSNSQKLSPFETSWSDLAERGYKGGGVVVCLVNELNQVLLYEVPEGKSKPFINRYAGQMNLFVETADAINEEEGVAGLEPFSLNLNRAFEEEIGIEAPGGGIYREVDYMEGIRARCVLYKVNSSIIEQVQQHISLREQQTGKKELGRVEWINIDQLSQTILEPNAQGILEKLLADGLLVGEKQKNHQLAA
jgi:hypothetical protein